MSALHIRIKAGGIEKRGPVPFFLPPDEFSNCSEEIRTVNVAFGIHGDALCHTRTGSVWIRTRVRYEIFDRAVPGASNPNASLGAQVICVAGLWESELSRVGPAIPRLRVGDVDHIVS